MLRVTWRCSPPRSASRTDGLAASTHHGQASLRPCHRSQGGRGAQAPRVAAPSPPPAWRMARNDTAGGDWGPGVDATMTVQQNAAGSLRVSLSSSCSSPPKTGGQGVDCSLEDNANRSREHARRWAQPTLHVDSRLRGNDKTSAANSPREVLELLQRHRPGISHTTLTRQTAMLKADLHMHTRYSFDCTTTPEAIVKRCQKLGINCIAVADHGTIEGALARQADRSLPGDCGRRGAHPSGRDHGHVPHGGHPEQHPS